MIRHPFFKTDARTYFCGRILILADLENNWIGTLTCPLLPHPKIFDLHRLTLRNEVWYLLGPICTKRKRQCCNVASQVTLIKIVRGESLQKGLLPQLIKCDASVDADAPNQSMTLDSNGPLHRWNSAYIPIILLISCRQNDNAKRSARLSSKHPTPTHRHQKHRQRTEAAWRIRYAAPCRICAPLRKRSLDPPRTRKRKLSHGMITLKVSGVLGGKRTWSQKIHLNLHLPPSNKSRFLPPQRTNQPQDTKRRLLPLQLTNHKESSTFTILCFRFLSSHWLTVKNWIKDKWKSPLIWRWRGPSMRSHPVRLPRLLRRKAVTVRPVPHPVTARSAPGTNKCVKYCIFFPLDKAIFCLTWTGFIQGARMRTEV